MQLKLKRLTQGRVRKIEKRSYECAFSVQLGNLILYIIIKHKGVFIEKYQKISIDALFCLKEREFSHGRNDKS